MTKRQIFNGWQKITNTQKTEDWDAQTTKNPAVRTALIPLHGRKSWGQLLLKLREGGKIVLPLPLFGIKFKKKKLFYFSMEAYIVHLANLQGYKDIWTRVCFETIVTFFFFLIVAVLKIYQTNITNTFFVHFS